MKAHIVLLAREVPELARVSDRVFSVFVHCAREELAVRVDESLAVFLTRAEIDQLDLDNISHEPRRQSF